jgi:hypothetical protein
MTAARASASCSHAVAGAFDAGERSLGVFETQHGAINKIQSYSE